LEVFLNRLTIIYTFGHPGLPALEQSLKMATSTGPSVARRLQAKPTRNADRRPDQAFTRRLQFMVVAATRLGGGTARNYQEAGH
jgi:hypothetical protein